MLTFAGDTKSLDSATARATKDIGAVDHALDNNARHAQAAGSSLDSVGEHLENSTGKFRGGKDIVDGFSDSMGALGVSLPGPIGNIAMMAGGVADLADGIATSGLPLIKKLWALIAANPLIAIAALVVALGIALYELYQHSETFRNAVHKLWAGVQAAFGGIEDAGKSVFGALSSWFDAAKNGVQDMGKVFAKVADALFLPYKTAFNLIADAWNNTIGRLHVHTPGVFGHGSIDFDMPTIPHFANGGALGGPSIVGERGPELFVPPGAGRIVPNSQLARGGGTTIVMTAPAGSLEAELLKTLRKYIRVNGGVVQTVLGA
jgi:hypothetical protein